MRFKNYSPLRYPGGKSRLTEFFTTVIRLNNLQGGTYIEPFSGGAAIALFLAIEGYMDKVVINDFDRSIYAFWYSVLNFTDSFVDRIRYTDITIDEWKKQKKVQSNKRIASLLDLGFSTFFLNRTNHSGVLKAGVIGGLSQNGLYKIDARYNKEQLIERIQQIAAHKKHFILHNDNAIDLLHKYKHLAHKNLIYLDPPYFVKGQELYVNFFSKTNHVDLFNTIQRRDNMNWIVTYDNHEFIRELYNNYPCIVYKLPYSAGATKEGSELLIHTSNITIPKNIITN